MSDLLQIKRFTHRQEAIDADVISFSLRRFLDVCVKDFRDVATFGNVDVPEHFKPMVILFTAIPSRVHVPDMECRCMVVGTTSLELDAFFASQYTLLQSCVMLHPQALRFAATNCQHSALKYILVKLSLLGHAADMQLSLLKFMDGRNPEHVLAMDIVQYHGNFGFITNDNELIDYDFTRP